MSFKLRISRDIESPARSNLEFSVTCSKKIEPYFASTNSLVSSLAVFSIVVEASA